jgi:hypothetical protein
MYNQTVFLLVETNANFFVCHFERQSDVKTVLLPVCRMSKRMPKRTLDNRTHNVKMNAKTNASWICSLERNFNWITMHVAIAFFSVQLANLAACKD